MEYTFSDRGLKSNMDRFIVVVSYINEEFGKEFKIQYG